MIGSSMYMHLIGSVVHYELRKSKDMSHYYKTRRKGFYKLGKGERKQEGMEGKEEEEAMSFLQ